MGSPPDPLVSVVVVNYNGGAYLPGLLDRLRQQTYEHLETLLVDNASTDGSAELVAGSYPEVRLLRSSENLGFAGGNNLGIAAARGELVALINNDTLPDPDWLRPLVAASMESAEIAAVGSKIVFLTPFVPVRLSFTGVGTLLVDPDSAFEGCDYRKAIFHETSAGRTGLDDGTPWRTRGQATLLLPVASRRDDARLRLLVSAEGTSPSAAVEVAVGATTIGRIEPRTSPIEGRFDLPAATVAAEAVDVINNAGSFLDRRGNAGDRGIYEPDRGQYDRPEDLTAICGAAVLLRRSALERVGLFDRDLFTYYEDADLSWRLRSAGYRLRYEPASLVRHAHATSSVAWSPSFVFYTARNRILMIAKNGSFRLLLTAYRAELARIIRLLGNRLPGSRVAGWRTEELERELRTRLRVQASLVWQIPRALLKRAGRSSHA